MEIVPKKFVCVLDPKRSNSINIGLTALPPIRAIRAAILTMDNTVLNREAIEVHIHDFAVTKYLKYFLIQIDISFFNYILILFTFVILETFTPYFLLYNYCLFVSKVYLLNITYIMHHPLFYF